MRKLLFANLISLFLTSSLLQAEALNKAYSFANYKEAAQSENYLKFDMQSTKVGFITTSFTGYAQQFSISGEKNNGKISNATVTVIADSLDTDISARNDKMKSHCLDVNQYPEIVVRLSEDIDLTKEKQVLTGSIIIRGTEKSLKVNLTVSPQGQSHIVSGTTTVQLDELGIPDPSIFIAKVKKDVVVSFKFSE